MKRIVSLIMVTIIISGISFGIYYFKGGNKNYIESSYHNELILKGIQGAKAVAFDNDGKIYISINNEIIMLDENKQRKTLFSTDNIVNDLEYYNGRLYYTSKYNLSFYDLKTKETSIIINNIPNNGECNDSKILIKDDSIYLTIAAATNSGIVDNRNLSYDLMPKDMTLSGKNYNENTNGAFMEYGHKGYKGQEIKKAELGNASIVKININSGERELYCYGIRNIKGMDYNKDGKIFGVVGGIEERGFRGLVGDIDYVYELKGKETWYGWPDYSGGDPVSSPRFRVEGKPKITFVLDNHPSYNPPAPFYQHETINTLDTMAIDRDGVIGEVNSIFTFDSNKGELLNILKEGAVSSKLSFQARTKISDLKIHGNDLYILDSENGYLTKISENIQNLNQGIVYKFLLAITMLIIVILVIKLTIDFKGENETK